MDVYAHAIPSNDEAAAEIVGDLLGGNAAEPSPESAAVAPQTEAPAANPPSAAGDGGGIPKELLGTILAQLPPEKLVELLKAAV